MTEEYKGDYFHIVTRQSQAAEIVVPIPSFCKPLAVSVRPYGGGEAGLLASYFDPDQHAWIVRQLPVNEAWPHQPPPCLTIRVMALVDPANLYELRLSLSSVLDGLENNALYALQRRSQLYELLAEEHLADKSGATLRAAAADGQLPQVAEAVTLAAPLQVMDGFVLTGGGFLSDFPVLRDGPAMPRSMDTVYDDILAGEDFCGPPKPGPRAALSTTTVTVASASSPLSSSSNPGKGAADPASESREYTAWSVTAAANAGLACLSIGLRRRSPLEWSELAQHHAHPLEHGSSAAHNAYEASLLAIASVPAPQRPRSTVAVTSDGVLSVVQAEDDPTGLVASERASTSGVPGTSSYGAAAPATSGPSAPRPLMETLTLRGEVEVQLARREGEMWRISLPPPHGELSFAMGASRALMTAARKHFYCD